MVDMVELRPPARATPVSIDANLGVGTGQGSVSPRSPALRGDARTAVGPAERLVGGGAVAGHGAIEGAGRELAARHKRLFGDARLEVLLGQLRLTCAVSGGRA